MRNVLLLLSLSLGFSSWSLADWEVPNTPLASIGDPGNLYLNTQGLTYHFNNNDFAGQTDKLMSGSTGLYYYRVPNEGDAHDGYEFSANARLLIPVVATRFDQPKLATPQGVYGDSIELRTGYSRIIETFKIEGSLSADLYGHYNGDEIQKRVHRIIGSDNHQDDYGAKFYSSYFTGAIGVGKFLGPDFLAMVYYRNAAVVKDYMIRFNYKHQWGNWQVGAQYLIAKQISSSLYENDALEKERHEWAIGMKWKWYQNSFSYVSRYLSYDQFGQYYLDPLILSYEF
jgi:hypothetical protein